MKQASCSRSLISTQDTPLPDVTGIRCRCNGLFLDDLRRIGSYDRLIKRMHDDDRDNQHEQLKYEIQPGCFSSS